jgi:arsenite methyltransferase
MKSAETIRESVSAVYARALKVGSCCGAAASKGILVKRAGYQHAELAAIPDEAVHNSFGCGNPLSFSNVQPGDVVLDLGSGAGIDVVLAAQKVGPAGRVIGVDMTDEMITAANQVIRRAGLGNAEIRKGLIEQLPVESATVDWVISNCVINLSPEKSKVFREMARVLKPGGRVLISDIVAEDLSDETRSDLRLYSCCVSGAISEQEYRDGLAKCGFVDVSVQRLHQLDFDQLGALMDSDRAQNPCCQENAKSPPTSQAAQACAGQVWTAAISARKPAPTDP